MHTEKILFLTGVVAALFLVIDCSKPQKEAATPIRPVRCQAVTASGLELRRTFSGVSKAAMEVKLSFKVGGTVRVVKVKVGDKVVSGDVIATLDKYDYQLMYEQATVALNNARVQMLSAKSAFERTAALYESGNSALQEYERAKTGYASAMAAVESSERGQQLAKSQLRYSRLLAPMAGVVAKVHVEKNENVGSGQLVAEINSGTDIEVTIGIPEAYISRIQEGDNASVVFSALRNKQFEGVISEVAYGINSSSSTYPVSIILTNPSDDIRPGMAAEAMLAIGLSGKNETKIVVPLHAVAEDHNSRFVYVVKASGHGTGVVSKQTVHTGELRANGFEITDGLDDGDLIVTAGISKLVAGMTVKIMK